jgi:hypothetical protein
MRGSWRGVISLGFGPDGKRIRRKVRGQSKADVKVELRALHEDLREELHTSATYTVRDAVEDWLAGGLDGRSAKTVSTHREVLDPLTAPPLASIRVENRLRPAVPARPVAGALEPVTL